MNGSAVLKTVIGQLLLFAVFPAAFAAEIDSVTLRPAGMDNATDELNTIFNQRIEQGVKNANARIMARDRIPPCDEQTLFTELRKAVFQSRTASLGLKGYALDRQMREQLGPYSLSLTLDDSIYSELNVLESFSVRLKALSDIVSLDGHLVGLDKIGHFFAEGWKYYEMIAFDGESPDSAIAWGEQQEQGKYGYTTTGVYSFADLTANFNGWLFWNKILLRYDDPLKSPLANIFSRPYVSCRLDVSESLRQWRFVRSWSYNHRFDFSDYIDGAWDEGNNCNSYKATVGQKVTRRMQETIPEYRCPLDVNACAEAAIKYRDFSDALLHPACLGYPTQLDTR